MPNNNLWHIVTNGKQILIQVKPKYAYLNENKNHSVILALNTEALYLSVTSCLKYFFKLFFKKNKKGHVDHKSDCD